MEKPRSVAIIDGFGEGRWHSKLFRRALKRAGFITEKDDSKADIVVTHSTGCYYLPYTTKEQLVVIIGPPYWPGKSLTVAIAQKVYRDFRHRVKEGKLGYWLVKTAWNLLYIFSDFFYSIKATGSVRKHNFHEKLVHTRLVLVRNMDDALCTPDIEHIPFGNKKVSYYAMPGDHDDCWLHPEKYVKLIEDLMI